MPLTPQTPRVRSLLEMLETTPAEGVRVDPFKVNALLDSKQQAPPAETVDTPEDADGFLSTMWQIPLGFVEGFTTLSFGEQPTDTNSAIARKVGNLLGFVGYVPSPVNLFRAGALRFLTRFAGGKVAKNVATKVVQKAGVKGLETFTQQEIMAEALKIARAPKFTNAINIRSVPMWATDAMMASPAGRGLAEASRKLISQSKYIKTGNRFLNEGMVSSIGHGAIHLGLASTISAAGVNPLEWKERIDDALPAMFSGMVFGAGFAGIGNLGLMLGRSMSGGNPELAKKTLQGVAGAVFQGLPSTMQNASTPEQVYEYLLGAWFGFHSQPWTAKAAGAKVKDIRDRFATQPEREVESLLRDVKNPEQFEKDMGLDLIRKQGPQGEKLADDVAAQYFASLPGMKALDAQKLFKDYRIAQQQNLGGVYFTTPDGTQYLAANEGLTIAERGLVQERITELVDQAMATGQTVKATPIERVAAEPVDPVKPSVPRYTADGQVQPPSGLPVLPRVLSGAKPRYGYRENNFEVSFASDVDRALYIISQPKASKQDPQYVAWLKFVTGISDVDALRKHGQRIRDEVIKPLAKVADGVEPITVPAQDPIGKLKPTPAPKPKPVVAAKPKPEQKKTKVEEAYDALSNASSVEIPTSVLSDRGMLYRYFQNKIAVSDVYQTLGGKRGALARETGFVEALALKKTLDQYGAIGRWADIKGKFQMSQAAAQELYRYKTSEHEVRVYGDKRSELAGLQNLKPGDTVYHRELGALKFIKTVEGGKRRGQIWGRDKFGRVHRVGKTKTGEVLSFAPWQETKLSDRPEFLTSFMRKWFTSSGDLPVEAQGLAWDREAYVRKFENRTRKVESELNRVLKEEWGTTWEKLTPDQIDLVNMVLTGQGTPDALPAKIAEVASVMRDQIDIMTRMMIRSGAVQGELAAVMDKNEGMYVHRQYRVWNEPGFAEKMLERVRTKDADAVRIWNRVVTLLKSEHPEWTEAEAGRYIETVLLGGKESSDFIKRSTLGAKDLSMFIPRQDIAPEIRALWGEYTNPMQSYALSVMKMAGITANHNFQKQVVEAGLGKWLFEPGEQGGTIGPDPFNSKRTVRFSEKIAETGAPALNLLSGYYTTPEIANAFKQFMDPTTTGPVLQAYMRVNGGVKMGKTVGSVMTHIRNLSSFFGFTLANGNFFHPDAAAASFKTVMGELRAASEPGKSYKLGTRQYSQQGFIERMIQLEVMGSGANAGEWRAIMKDAGGGTLQDFIEVGAKRKIRRALLDFPQALYAAEDDFVKVYNFIAEFEKYSKANTGMSQEQLERYAAQIVKDTNPTYSRVSRAVQMARRAPFVGAFVAFPAEIMRTGKNIIGQIGTELSSDNAAVREIGYGRLAGALMAALLPTAAALTTRFLMGIDKEEDEDFRRYLPPWAKNSELLYLGRNDAGSYKYVQASYSDPYSYLKEPLLALMRGTRNEDVVQGLYDSIAQGLSPFLGEEILSKAILDVVRNKKEDTGAPVYNEVADVDTRAEQIGEYMLKVIQPGTLASMQRIASGLNGETNLYGRDYDAGTEALAAFSGVRVENMDLAQGLSFKARNFSRDMSQASRILSQVAGSRGGVDAAEIEKAYVEMEQSRQRLWLEFYRDVRAARRMGIDDDQVRVILKAASVPQQMQEDLIAGVYRAKKVDASFLQQVEKLSAIKGMDANVKSRRELVQALEAKYQSQRLGVLPPEVLLR